MRVHGDIVELTSGRILLPDVGADLNVYPPGTGQPPWNGEIEIPKGYSFPLDDYRFVLKNGQSATFGVERFRDRSSRVRVAEVIGREAFQ
jgi:hypothetical protein